MLLAVQQRGSQTSIAIELKIDFFVWVEKWINKQIILGHWRIEGETLKLIVAERKHYKLVAVEVVY